MSIESQILGAVLSDSTGALCRLLVEKTVESDYTDGLDVFKCIKGLVSGKSAVTWGIVKHDLPHHAAYLESIRNLSCDFEPGVERLKTYAKIRNLRESSNILNRKEPTYNDYVKLLSEYEKTITEIFKQGYASDRTFRLQDGLSSYYDKLAKQIQENKKGGIPTGFPRLDEISGGLRGGETWVIAGRPSMGKSSKALTMYTWQVINGYRPAYYSGEVSFMEVYNKVFSIMSDIMGKPIPYQALRNPYGQKAILEKLLELTPIIQNGFGNLSVDYTFTFSGICTSIRELARKNMIDVAYIDQLTLLVKDQRYAKEELNQYSRDFKKLAEEIQIPIVELTQLSREAEAKGIPNLSHLKGSGGIEENADVVLFPWRQCIVDRNAPKEEAMLIIGKARNFDGEPIMYNFSTVTTRFKESSNAKSF